MRRARRSVQVWESPPAITVPGRPSLPRRGGVLDAAAALVVERDALLLRPPLQPRLELGRLHVLRGHEVVRDHHDARGVEHMLGTHLLHRTECDRARDVVGHHDVAADGDDLTGPDVLGVAVREEDLLTSVRANQPSTVSRHCRATRRRRASGRCRTTTPRRPRGCGRRPPRVGRQGGTRAGARRRR